MKEKEEVQEKLAKMTDLLQKMSKEKDDVIEEYVRHQILLCH